MRYCQRCNVPRMLIKEHHWGSNGTIFLANDPTHRMVIVDNEALTNIFQSISDRIGLPVDKIVTEAKRKNSRHFISAILTGPKGILVRELASAKVYEQLSKQVSMLGFGGAEVVGYRRRRFLEGVITEAYNGPALAGDICGAFDIVERTNSEVEFSVDFDGTLHLSVVAAGDGQFEEFSERFEYKPPPALPGRSIFELCPVCRAPIELGRQYSFNMERGVVYEVKTGHRVVLIGVMTLKNLFGELEDELGSEIPEMIMNIERERVREVIAAKGKKLDTSPDGYMRFMGTLELKGMGRASGVKKSSRKVEARVDNPYFEPLIAGFLGGFYEATSGRDCKVSWTDANVGYTEITIVPA